MAPFTAINRRRSSKSQSPQNNNFPTSPTKQSPKSKSKSPFTLPLIENIPKARILTSEAVSRATMAPAKQPTLKALLGPRQQPNREVKVMPSIEPSDETFDESIQDDFGDYVEARLGDDGKPVVKNFKKRKATASSSGRAAKRGKKRAVDDEDEDENEQEETNAAKYAHAMQQVSAVLHQVVTACTRAFKILDDLQRTGVVPISSYTPVRPATRVPATTTSDDAEDAEDDEEEAKGSTTDGRRTGTAPWSWTEERDVLDLKAKSDFEQMSPQEREDMFATYEPNKKASQFRTWQSIRQRIKLLEKEQITKADLEREKKTHTKILKAKAAATAAAGAGMAIAGPSNAASKKAGTKKSASKKSAAEKTTTKKASSKTATPGQGKQKAVEDDDEIMEDVDAQEDEDGEAIEAPEPRRSTRSKSRSRSAEA